MKYYYALFKKTASAIEVKFPDLSGCVTFGKNWEDALAAWLAHAEKQFITPPSSHEQLRKLKGDLVPVIINNETMASYQELKRFNLIFPSQVLNRIDAYRKKVGLKRSTFLQKAAEEYLQHCGD